jgi:Peptidase A4 family
LRYRIVITGIVLAACLGLPTLAAAASSGSRPAIASIKASPAGVLPHGGSAVTLTVRVRSATRCSFLRQRKPGAKLTVFRTRPCTSGRAEVKFPAVANRAHSAVRLTYAVRVTGPGQQAEQRKLTRREAAAPTPAPTANLTVAPMAVPATGGQVKLTYASTHAKKCSLAATPDLWSGSNPLSVPCNGAGKLVLPANDTAVGGQWKLTFTAKGSAGASAADHGTLTEDSTSVVQSTNWSGYVLPASTEVTIAAGTFTVPTLDCKQTPNAAEATWVGIGGAGAGTGDLLQTGVESDCSGGVQTDNPAWWEEYPEVAGIDFSGMTVSPGDEIEASVYRPSGGTTIWETCVDDVTKGTAGVMLTGDGWGVTTGGCGGSFTNQGSTASLSYAGGTTAEWIVEDFSNGNSLVPFADYGTLTFSNLQTSLASWSLATAAPVEMVQSGSIVSLPSAPTADGFSVSYKGPGAASHDAGKLRGRLTPLR